MNLHRVGAGAIHDVAVIRCDALASRATDRLLNCEKGREIYHFSWTEVGEGFLLQVDL